MNAKLKKVFCYSLTAAIWAAIVLVFHYFVIPAWTIRSPGLWWFIMVSLAIPGAVFMLIAYRHDLDGIFSVAKIGWISIAAILAVFLILGICSWEVFHTKKLQSITEITVSEAGIDDFEDISNPENLETIPLIDLDTAITLGDKKLASIPHAEWYEVDDEYNLIQYQGDYYRLSAIDYASYFKYRKAKDDGVPGYVLVSATPDGGKVAQDAKIVLLDKPIRYTPGAFFEHDLSRHLRWQYPSYIFDTSYLEIDENGAPYYVTGVMRPSAGPFGGKVVNSFILTNAQTGESQEYAIGDAPKWIDHIYSLKYLMKVAYWHYSYTDGYWNNFFSKTGVWRTSYEFRDTHKSDGTDSGAEQFANFYGYSSIISKNGEVMFYTGLTAANNAESNLGWITIDPSTGKMIQYEIVGAEESSAQAAVEQLVQEKGYEATFPIPVNIDGAPSYLMCLKGKAGLVQSYGIVNMENFSITVLADNLDEAIRQYRVKMGNPDAVVGGETATEVVEPIGEIQEASGKITNIKTAEINGTTQYYYVIDGELYRAAITIDERQVLYKIGDEISFSYYVDGNINVITELK